MADAVQKAEYTSIFERIHNKIQLPYTPKPLLDFMDNKDKNSPKGIAFTQLDYLTPVAGTGKVIRADKYGNINEKTCPLLTALGINSDDWLELAEHFGKEYHQAFGSLEEPNAFAAHTDNHWIGGATAGIFSPCLYLARLFMLCTVNYRNSWLFLIIF